MTCWLLENALVDSCGTLVPLKSMVGLRDCSGRIDPHHLVTKQQLKHAFPLGAVIDHHERPPKLIPAIAMWTRHGKDADRPLPDLFSDERNIVPACRRHHDLVHGRRLRIPRDSLPWKTETFAAELGLDWWLDREFGFREEAA